MKIEDLKRCAGEISQAYIMRGQNMTEAIYAVAREQGLNHEQVRRLCEIANQNTYLELFQDKEKRGNIVFDVARSDDVIKSVEEHNVNELDYKTAPEDFRKHANLQTETGSESTTMDSNTETLASDNLLSPAEVAIKNRQKKQAQDKIDAMKNSVTTMKVDEAAALENAVDKVAEIARDLCSEGDSFADMAKLALRHTVATGNDTKAVVVMLDKVAAFVRSRGFNVSAELTKVSEMAIDPKFKLFGAIDSFNMSIQKLAGLNEMETNLVSISKAFTVK